MSIIRKITLANKHLKFRDSKKDEISNTNFNNMNCGYHVTIIKTNIY